MGRYSFTPEEMEGGRYTFTEEEEWVRRGPLLVNTRTGAVKLAPVPKGAKPTVKLEGGEVKPTEPPKPQTLSPGAAVARGLFGPFASPTFRSYVKEGLASAAELPALAESVVRSGIEKGPLPLGGARGPLPPAKTLKLRGPLEEARRSVREEYEGARDQFLENAVEAGAPPVVAAIAETGVQSGAIAADPTNFLPAGGALKAARSGRYAFTAAEEAGEAVAKQAPDIARMTEREILEAAHGDIRPLSPGYGGDAEGRIFARWLERRGIDPDRAATDHDLKALQDEFFDEMNPEPSLEELGVEVVGDRNSALSAPRSPDLPPPGTGGSPAPDPGLLGRAGAESGPSGGVHPVEPPAPGVRGLNPGLSAARQAERLAREAAGEAPRISTKGLENVAGLEDDIHELAVAHMAELDAARNAPEVLERLAGQKRGQQVLGGLTAEHTRLRRAIEAEADPLARASLRERKDLLKRDLVQVLAKQQAGYSEGGKMLRQAQDSVDALAGDEALRLKNELLKQYQNPLGRPVVAEVEERAMKRLQREARYSARKGQRAEAKVDLDEEFSALSREFGKKAATPRMGLDPELAAIVGKMARNRVQAGLTTVEEIADFVYQQVAPYVEGLTLNQVRATVVSEAMTPKKRSPVRSLIPDRQQALLKRYREVLDDDDVVEKIAILSDDPNSDDLVNFLRQMERPRFRDFAGAYMYGNLLSGPKTLVRNALGNTVKLATDTLMRPVEALVDAPLARLQGRLQERYAREFLPSVVGLAKGAPDGFRRFLQVLRKGYDPARLADELSGRGGRKWAESGKLPLDPFVLSQNPKVRAAGAVIGYGPRLLSATDGLFRSMANSSARHAWAVREAIKEGADDIGARAADLLAEQPEEMLTYAAQAARKATFTDEMSNIGKWVSRAREIPGPAGTFAGYAMPFVHVPDRVAAFVADFIPGVRSIAIRKALKEGSPVASDLIARQAVGTAAAVAATGWAFQGKIVGSAPREEKLRNDFYASGKQPFSVLLGGRWVPIRDVFGGLAGPVVLGAAVHENWRSGVPVEAEDILRAAGGTFIAEGRYLLDASYLSTLADTVEAIEKEPDQAGTAGARLAGRTATGFLLPFSGLQRTVATASDTGPEGDPRVLDIGGFTDEVKSAIPGLRQQVPARYDTMDQLVEQSTGRAGAFSPVVPTENKVADPKLSAYVSRLRRSMEGRAGELRQVQEAIAAAKLEGDTDREMTLRDGLPPVTDPVAVARAAMDQVREKEELIRQNRANRLLPEDFKAYLEAQYMDQIRQILERSLTDLEAP